MDDVIRQLEEKDINHVISNVLLDDDYLLLIEAKLNTKYRLLEICTDVYIKSGYSNMVIPHKVVKDGTAWVITATEPLFGIEGLGVPLVYASFEDMERSSELVICWHLYLLGNSGELEYCTLRSYHRLQFDKSIRRNHILIDEYFADEIVNNNSCYDTVIGAKGCINAKAIKNKWLLDIEDRKAYKTISNKCLSETERLFYAEVLNEWPDMSLAERLMAKNSAKRLKWKAQIFVQTNKVKQL